MMCYKDMTFCWSDCTNTSCHRYFGATQEKEADMWWGGPNAPVALSDFSGSCPDYKPKGVCVKETIQ